MAVEANITAEANVTRNMTALFVDDDGPTPTPNIREVTLCTKKVGRATERDGALFPMTHDPFPVNDRRANVMRVREHPKFAGWWTGFLSRV